MALVGSLGRIFKPIVSNVVKAVAPKALEALKGIAGKGISSLFEAGTKGLQNLVSKLPIAGPFLSKLIGKYAPGLQDAAKNWASGLLDKLMSRLMGAPTSRPVPGTPPGTSVTPPPMTDPARGQEIINNTPRPSSNTNASTGSNVSGSTSENATMSNLGWSGGPPDPSKYKMDTPEGAAKFQQDNTRYQQTMNNIQLMYSTLSNTLAAMASTAKAIGANVRI